MAAFVGSLERLAIERNDALDLRCLRKRLHEPSECLLELQRIEHAEHAAERVVARNPAFQRQNCLEQRYLGPRKQRYVATALGSAQRCQKCDEQQLREIVQRVFGPRIRQVRKAFRKAPHQRLPSNQEPPSESICPLLAIAWLTHAHMRFPCLKGEGLSPLDE